MILVRHGGFGSKPDEREVAWPAGWRLPAPGDNISLEPGWGGFVEYVSFAPYESAVRVRLR